MLQRSPDPVNRPLSHRDYLALKRFPALDGLRAIAALLVVFFHNNGPDWLQGWIGVQIFFVISGFLITTLMLREEDRNGRISFRDFFVRRVFRILPMYFVILGVTLVIQLRHGTVATTAPGSELPKYLLFLNEFGHGGLYGQSWTLGVEQKFYLLWPLLAFAPGIAARAGRSSLRIGLSLGLMAISLAAVPFTLADDPKGWPAHYFSILIGCLLAILLHHPTTYALLRPLTRPWVASVAAGTFLGVHLGVRHFVAEIDRHHLAGDVAGVIAITPLYAAVTAVILLPALIANAVPQRLLSSRVMVFLGERSYSIYLIQNLASDLVIALCPSLRTSPLLVLVVIPATVALSHFTCQWVERPMIRFGQSKLKGSSGSFRPASAGRLDTSRHG
ncbi:peptidoglycan/LPS O-acetylase OafA/YrhL [Kribbella aluminosa]|uniref:Peptidoglycan/LPS O-acetylase OafA/YrhL n=1 Tax=Kribbella aluminosa TaxID=416017 RepID=A0ABS4UHQ8_9ACTN|nr:acyltransferase [Kribbella aluminosa]MBP2351164.1 peptidoglycan/LPS O-acetylase OafA/YrhL [Kribbella aluminosa]